MLFQLENFKYLARGTHLNCFCNPVIPVAIPQRAKQGDSESGYKLVENEASCLCSLQRQQQILPAAGSTRLSSVSQPHT